MGSFRKRGRKRGRQAWRIDRVSVHPPVPCAGGTHWHTSRRIVLHAEVFEPVKTSDA